MNNEKHLPWYEIGTPVGEAKTMEEVMKIGKLDYNVQKVQSYIPMIIDEYGNPAETPSSDSIIGKMRAVPGAFVTRRMDTGTPFGMVGNKYQVVQNTDAYTLFDPLIADGSLRVISAGCFEQNGARIWVLAEVGDPVLLVEGDELKRYVILINAHDGSSALKLLNVPTSETRGTVPMAYSREHSLSIRHTASAQERLNKARDVVSSSLKFYENFIDSARRLIAKKLSYEDVQEFIQSMFKATIVDGKPEYSARAQNQMALIRHIYNGERISATRYTAWSLYNAVVEFVDHHRNATDTIKQQHSRLKSISMGSGADMKKQAFKILTRS